MARANFVKSAQKDNPVAKKGESYYWWQLHRGPKRYSKTPPKRSQLTGSSFLSALYDIEDDMVQGAAADDGLPSTRDDIVSALEELRDQCQESLDNMPEGLQEGPTGEMLQNRIDGLESAISEFEDIDMDEPTEDEFIEPPREDGELNADHADRVEQARDEHEAEQASAIEDHWQEKLEELQSICIDVG